MTGKYKNLFYREDLENLTEEIVFQEIHALAEGGEPEFCQCDACIQDIAAIVLNRVSSLYCCSPLEKVIPGGDLQERIREIKELVRQELPKAIETVTLFSHHMTDEEE